MRKFEQRELVRDYQRNRLGRSNEDERLMELLPLPSPSSEQWRYPAHSRLPWLANRKVYTHYQAPRPAKRVFQDLKNYRPKLLTFYGPGFPAPRQSNTQQK